MPKSSEAPMTQPPARVLGKEERGGGDLRVWLSIERGALLCNTLSARLSVVGINAACGWMYKEGRFGWCTIGQRSSLPKKYIYYLLLYCYFASEVDCYTIIIVDIMITWIQFWWSPNQVLNFKYWIWSFWWKHTSTSKYQNLIWIPTRETEKNYSRQYFFLAIRRSAQNMAIKNETAPSSYHLTSGV